MINNTSSNEAHYSCFIFISVLFFYWFFLMLSFAFYGFLFFWVMYQFRCIYMCLHLVISCMGVTKVHHGCVLLLFVIVEVWTVSVVIATWAARTARLGVGASTRVWSRAIVSGLFVLVCIMIVIAIWALVYVVVIVVRLMWRPVVVLFYFVCLCCSSIFAICAFLLFCQRICSSWRWS
jgi:hypothetical protein